MEMTRNDPEYHSESSGCVTLHAVANPRVFKQRIRPVAVFKVNWNGENREEKRQIIELLTVYQAKKNNKTLNRGSSGSCNRGYSLINCYL